MFRSAGQLPRSPVLVARGDEWVDAIAVAPLAAARGWPVLLTTPEALPAVTAEALAQLDAQEVVVVGGVAAVSPQVAEEAGATARWGGEGREATAVAVAREGWGRRGAGAADAFVIVAGAGDGWQHALAATPLAAAAQAPLLLAPPQGALGAATREYLDALGYPPGATATAYLAGLATPGDLFAVGRPG